MLLLPGCSKTYEISRALLAASDDAGYVLLGQLGASWPATLVGERDAVDGIEFEAPGRGSQSYSPADYRGRTFKLLRLPGQDGHEFVILLRSKHEPG